uniref:72 kDa inositol polyphosphate 5-phosphatase n=1 Tax=Schistocephalus solidus TaxID=70667 RepID=A0A183T8E7_SCHSO
LRSGASTNNELPKSCQIGNIKSPFTIFRYCFPLPIQSDRLNLADAAHAEYFRLFHLFSNGYDRIPYEPSPDPSEHAESCLKGPKIFHLTVADFLPDEIYRTRLDSDLFVRRRLEEREADYCSWKTLKVFIGSWNVNGRQDTSVQLDDWMSFPDTDQPPADIYVFGFQELDLSLGGMALNKATASPFEPLWLRQLESAHGGLLRQSPASTGFGDCVGDGAKGPARFRRRWSKQTGGGFRRLPIVRLAGLLLIVYVSRRLYTRAHVSEICLQSVPTGMFNVMVS